MRKLIDSLDGGSEERVAAGGTFGSKAAALLRRGQVAGRRSQALVIALGLLLIVLLGWINLIALRGLNFEFFYLLACALVGWLAGARGAIGCTLASGVCLYFADTLAGGVSRPGWMLLCNSLIRLLAFAAIGWLAAQAAKLTRDLEQTVAQHTGRLESEVEEHEETVELLRETVQLFRQLTENITDVFWVSPPSKQQVDYVSPAFQQVWGKTCRSLYDSPATWIEGIHPEDRERVTRAALTKQITGEYDEEYRVVRPDGSLRWVHDRAFPVKNEAGEVYRLVGIAEDITDRKHNEHLLEAQRNMGVALSSTSDLQFALNRLLEVAVQLEGIDCGGVYLLERETGDLRLEAHEGFSDAFSSRLGRYKADAPETRLAKAGEAVYSTHEEIPRSLDVLWGSEGLRALAAVPVKHQGAVLGLLILGSYQQDAIPSRTRVGIEMMASQVSGAIVRIRAEEATLEISDREQARIGQDVHDGLCQQLIGVAFNANSLEQALAAQQRPEAATARKICALLDEAITESRRVCRGLYPIRLRTQGLVPALEELAATTTERYKVKCRCEADTQQLRCDVTTATHLYRIAQEALNNALKHSGAGNITIQVREAGDGIDLQVKDDGKGFGAKPGPGSGMGLHIMDYRARLIGGSLQVQSSPDGTTVTCHPPQRIR